MSLGEFQFLILVKAALTAADEEALQVAAKGGLMDLYAI